MMKLLNPLVLAGLIFMLIVGSVAHLTYGSCQTSKWHNVYQRFIFSNHAPDWLITDYHRSIPGEGVLQDYTGEWKTWDPNGKIEMIENYVGGKRDGKYELFQWDLDLLITSYYKKGLQEGKYEGRYNDGSKQSLGQFVNNRADGQWVYWHQNGQISCIQIFDLGKIISSKFWKKDGSLNKKEYFDESGKFILREFFENDKVIKSENRQ